MDMNPSFITGVSIMLFLLLVGKKGDAQDESAEAEPMDTSNSSTA